MANENTILRTPDERFIELEDFSFKPNYIEIDDKELGLLRIHYLDEAASTGDENAPIILALHGQATWSYTFRKMIPIWTAAGYRVIAPDFIGFGRSDKLANEEDYTFYKHVDWIKAFLETMQLQNTHAFMFDWGGYFGLPIAAENPDYFASLTLVTTTLPRAEGWFNTLWIGWWRWSSRKDDTFPQADMVQNMTDTTLSDGSWQGLEAPYPDESFKSGPRSLPLLIPATSLNPATEPNRKAWEKLKNWTKPTQVMVSERLSKRGFNPQEFYDQIPGTKDQPHLIVPNTGFYIIEDKPKLLAEKTLEFLALNFGKKL